MDALLKRKGAGDREERRKNWVPDEDVKACGLCNRNFGLTNRRHHCRACGGVFCGRCCGSKTVLEKGPGHAQRVCTKCLEEQLVKDDSQFEKETQKRKEKEEQKAKDEEYVTHIYDKIGLVREIFKWLQGGCDVDLVSEGLERRTVRMWLQADPDSLCYVGRGEKAPDAAVLGTISRITLGFHKDVKGANVQKSEHDTMVTVYFSKPTKRERTMVAFCCKELVDFEAWVLGLSHITALTPRWGTPLSKLGGDKAVARALKPQESEKLMANRVDGSVYADVKAKVLQWSEEIKHHLWVFDGDHHKAWQAMGKGRVRPLINKDGAVYTTKGEVRNLSKLCVFRACALWEVLKEQNVVYDTNYIPSVGPGSEVATQKKPQAPQRRDTEEELRVDVSDGNAYTKKEFYAHYRSLAEWDTSHRAPYQKVTPRASDDSASASGSGSGSGAQASGSGGGGGGDKPSSSADAASAAAAAAPAAAAEAKAALPRTASEEAMDASRDAEEDAKRERKRLKRVCMSLVAASIAISTQAAYESKRAAKRAKKLAAAATAGGEEDEAAVAPAAAEEEAAVDDEEAEAEARREAKREKKRRKAEAAAAAAAEAEAAEAAEAAAAAAAAEEEEGAAAGGEPSEAAVEVAAACTAGVLSFVMLHMLERRKYLKKCEKESRKAAAAAAVLALAATSASTEAEDA